MEPLFSVCIPNFNYGSYMDITLNSLKSQTVENFEVLISDNASTDHSVEVIKKHRETGLPIQYVINPTNIGFAGNLDKVGSFAKAPWMIMLSSDDVVKNDALKVYCTFINLVNDTQDFAFCSTFEKIDSNGNFLEFCSPKKSSVWFDSDIDEFLTNKMGFDVYKVSAPELLKRCLTRFLNPFNFASTCYPREVYKKVGGYGGGRLYNPDKWFHWKLMSHTSYIYFLDIPLFQYRWHNSNQASQQHQNQTLKYWIDEYRNSFEVSDEMLSKSRLTGEIVKQAFMKRCIYAYAYSYAKSGDIAMAKRLLSFGYACYPNYSKSFIFYGFKILLGVPILNTMAFKLIAIIRKYLSFNA